MSLNKHIFKVGAWTGVSRILGFIRDMMVANVLGAGRLSDIFLAAFKLPNLFRDLLGEGALSMVFIPMFTPHKNRKKIGEFFASNVFSWLMAVLLAITIVAELFMPLIVWALAPGFAHDPGKLELTVVVSRIMFFYVIFVCGLAFLSGILNAFSEFGTVAAMPALLNVFMIAGVFLVKYHGAGDVAVYILAFAVVVAGIVQMGVLWARIRQRKFGLRLILPRRTMAIRTMLRRIGTGFVGTAFYHVNIFVGMLIASYQAGAVSWLYYSDRMVQLPFAIIGLAAGTVLLTTVSDALAEKNYDKVYAHQNSAMRNIMLFTLPCVAGLVVLAVPIMQFLFEHGAWTHDSTLAVARAMVIMALALPAMTTSQIFSRTLYASQDVRTPVKINIVTFTSFVIVALGLVKWLGYLSIPVATVVSGYFRNIWLRRVCENRGLFKTFPGTRRAMFAFGALSVLIGAGLWWVVRAGLITGIPTLTAVIAVAGAAYLPAAWTINKKLKIKN